MIVFDFAPLLTGLGVLALLVIFVLLSVFASFAKDCFLKFVFRPWFHWKTKKKLYRFEKQIYNDRVIEFEWLNNDREAESYKSRGDFYSFMLKEVFPKDRYIDQG